jgi:hypothetical protein
MIGEPDAGNPQVRFDERMQETGGNVPRLRPTLQHPQNHPLITVASAIDKRWEVHSGTLP